MSYPERSTRLSLNLTLKTRIEAIRAAKQAQVGTLRVVGLNEALADVLDWYDATADMRRLGITGTALRDLMAGDTE